MKTEGPYTMASDPNQDIKKSTVEVRQGTNRPKMIYVLGASVVLIIVVFAIIWAMQSH